MVEGILARKDIPPCLRREKKPHKAGNLYPLTSHVSPLPRSPLGEFSLSDRHSVIEREVSREYFRSRAR